MELLTYDFAKTVGDTIYNPWSGGIAPYFRIDTIFLNELIKSEWLFAYHPDLGNDLISFSDSVKIYASFQSVFDSSRVCVGHLVIEGVGTTNFIGFSSSNLIFYCRGKTDCSGHILTGFEEKITPAIKIYPNPASNSLQIQLSTFSGVDRITLFNPEGKELMSKNPTENKTIFNIVTLPPGLYFLQIHTTDNFSLYRKVLIK
ncbi:MAG: T9SS type A sorting domain-containing protein [Bacteroidia bacterium]